MALARYRLPLLRKELRGLSSSSTDVSPVALKEAQNEQQPSFPWQLASHQEIMDYLDRPDSQVSLDCYVSVLHRCIYSYSLGDGKRIHSHFMARNLQHHKLIGRLLVQLYARCGALHHALALFEGMPREDTSLWNIMIKENIKHGKRKEAISLYIRMCEAGIQPDQATFTAMLSAHAKPEDLDGGKLIHSLIAEKVLDTDRVVATALVTMYGKCDDLQSALNVSERILDQDLVTWNALIVVNCEHDEGSFALRLFWQMLYEGMTPNRVTLVNILASCTSKQHAIEAQKLHCYIICSNSDTDRVLGTALMNMYSKCGSVTNVRELFNCMFLQDVVSWNAIIAIYAEHGLHIDALQLFDRMKQESFLSDKITFVNTLDACSRNLDHSKGKQIHTNIIFQHFHSDFVIGTSLINLYGKSGSTGYAWKVFNDMWIRDAVAWNAMITAEFHNKDGKQTPLLLARMMLEGIMPCRTTFVTALSLFSTKEMLFEGKRCHVCVLATRLEADIMLGNTLINMYGKCDDWLHTELVFNHMIERDLVSWNVMISAYSQHESKQKAWQCFEQMQVEGFLPDKVTFVSILDACITQAALTRGKLLHCSILANCFTDVFVGSALVNMYGKCGSLEDAEEAFNHMPKQNAISWNALIATFAQHGKAKYCIQYFHRMKEEVKPDEATFTILLSACSHAGLIEEACDLFSCMTQRYDIEPITDHYACMIDLLGRAGRLEEAEDLLNQAPCKKNTVLYKTLLGACIHQKDIERGENAAKVAIEMNEDDPTPFVTLFNIYSSV